LLPLEAIMPVATPETRTVTHPEALFPVTRLVSTLTMSVRNGQLIAKPSLKPVNSN
jgi:hypothetical protein